MGFLDKVKTSLNDVSTSINNSLDNQKAEKLVKDEQKKIDSESKEIGWIVVECLDRGEEFNESMVSVQMARIREYRHNIAVIRGEEAPAPSADTEEPEPVQTVVSISVSDAQAPKPKPSEKEPEAVEEPAEDAPETEVPAESSEPVADEDAGPADPEPVPEEGPKPEGKAPEEDGPSES